MRALADLCTKITSGGTPSRQHTEYFAAVEPGHLNASAVAEVLVIRTLVRVLESPPAADVVDEDDFEIRLPGFNVSNKLLQAASTSDIQAALAFVGVRSNDSDAAPGGVLADFVGLVLGRVLLVFRGHADILRRAKFGDLR